MTDRHSPGARIAELRKTYSISREDLAERSGVNIEMIRRIEEEGLIPDLAPLVRISRSLGVRLGTLMDDHEELGPVITRGDEVEEATRFITGLPKDAAPASDGHRGLTFNALASDKSGRHMEPFIVDIAADAEQAKSSHEGEEFIHCLSGLVEIEYGGASYQLKPGDSAYYDSIVPHSVLAGGKAPARILAVIYTPA